MATHSSILAWEIPWSEEPGGLQSRGLQRVRHNWAMKHASLYFPVPSESWYVLRLARRGYRVCVRVHMGACVCTYTHVHIEHLTEAGAWQEFISQSQSQHFPDFSCYYHAMSKRGTEMSPEATILCILYIFLLLMEFVASSCPVLFPTLKIPFRERVTKIPYTSVWISCYDLPHGYLHASSVHLLSCVWLFATPWTASRQVSLSITNSQSWPKPMSIKLVMPSNHLILCHPLLLLPSIFPSIRVFSNESTLRIRWPKYWRFSFNISPSNEHPGLISFRMEWVDLLVVQGTLKSLLQCHSSKASILQRSASLWSNSHIHTWPLEKP